MADNLAKKWNEVEERPVELPFKGNEVIGNTAVAPERKQPAKQPVANPTPKKAVQPQTIVSWVAGGLALVVLLSLMMVVVVGAWNNTAAEQELKSLQTELKEETNLAVSMQEEADLNAQQSNVYYRAKAELNMTQPTDSDVIYITITETAETVSYIAVEESARSITYHWFSNADDNVANN